MIKKDDMIVEFDFIRFLLLLLQEMKEGEDRKKAGKRKGKSADGDDDDTEGAAGVRKRLKPNRNDMKGKKKFRK